MHKRVCYKYIQVTKPDTGKTPRPLAKRYNALRRSTNLSEGNIRKISNGCKKEIEKFFKEELAVAFGEHYLVLSKSVFV